MCGNIGKEMVEMLKPFNCKILVNDIVNYAEFYLKHNIQAVSKKELLSNAELVTLHVPLDDSTIGMIGKEELNLMKRESVLINTARGRVKEKNIRRDNRIALSIYDQENPYNMVTIRGKVTELTEEGADEHIDKLAKKYFGFDKYPNRSPGERRIILKIQPEKIFHMQPPQ